MVLVIILYICTKFCEIITKDFKVFCEDTISILKFAKGHYSIKCR